MSKIRRFILSMIVASVMCLTISTSALAWLVPENPCVLDGKSISAIIDGKQILSEEFDCDDNGYCSDMLTFYIEYGQDDAWLIVDIPVTCNGDIIYIDDMQCFLKNESLYCPAVDSDETVSFKAGKVEYRYPVDTPVFKLHLDD